MKLVVGLGNPGEQYSLTRHNAGFVLVDLLVASAGTSWKGTKFQGEMCEVEVSGKSCLLLKPSTYMNLSGRSVALVQRYFKIALSDVIAVHDDIDLPFGRVKVRMGGGHGGHNGIRSLVSELGTAEFPRLKIGVGRPETGVDVVGWVLGRFSQDELARIHGDIKQEALLKLSGLVAG